MANSLALLADAGHMTTDNLALGLALLAARWARRPPDPDRTYGYARAEILAALANGVVLGVLCVVLVVEALQRLQHPPEVQVGVMAGVAAGGLAVNVLASWLLHGSRHGLNVRAAYLHVLGDLLGSIGTLAAAGCLVAFGWRWADPVAGLLIAGILVVSSVRLVLESVNVLMEGAPSHVDAEEIRRFLMGVRGVAGVHDLHVWTLGGGGAPLLTAHVVMDHTAPAGQVLRAASAGLRERFGIDHATLQVEPIDFNVTLDGPGRAARGEPG